MRLIAALSVLLAVATASPVQTRSGNETTAEIEKRQRYAETVWMVDCTENGVQQSSLFYYDPDPWGGGMGYPASGDRCLVTSGQFKNWGGSGACTFPSGVSFYWNLWGRIAGLGHLDYAGYVTFPRVFVVDGEVLTNVRPTAQDTVRIEPLIATGS
ncbi:hypothetical protein VTJ49DRAFT_4242 [Mycothermus thermophilus]|uniref:Uncharacterized protein n=1 Tax=Humicola insolens TaxID=85995 RepID=A0ABR3VLN3_HUMIN